MNAETKIKIGKEKLQAPRGEYLARCVHVDPNWTFFKGGRKIACHFEVAEGDHAGATARLFYPLKNLPDGTHEIAPKSKFVRDVKKLFPTELEKGAIDPIDLFHNKYFNITVERRLSKKDGFNSIVKEIEHHDVGF